VYVCHPNNQLHEESSRYLQIDLHFLRDSVVGSGMCSGCNSFQRVSTVSFTILPTAVSLIRKVNAKARNDIRVERYLKQMNNYVLNFTNHKNLYNNSIQFQNFLKIRR
jgi:hypothetical protein